MMLNGVQYDVFITSRMNLHETIGNFPNKPSSVAKNYTSC